MTVTTKKSRVSKLRHFKLVDATLQPGSFGDEQLQLVVVPNLLTATSAKNIGELVAHHIAKEGANFRGKSVRITVEDLQVCRECGCTEDNACGQGCSWVEADLCSECTPEAIADREDPPEEP